MLNFEFKKSPRPFHRHRGAAGLVAGVQDDDDLEGRPRAGLRELREGAAD
jgi:hypothetical protein